jgi:hypothetical protein
VLRPLLRQRVPAALGYVAGNLDESEEGAAEFAGLGSRYVTEHLLPEARRVLPLLEARVRSVAQLFPAGGGAGTPCVAWEQLQALLLHYLALAEDGALPTGRGIAAWKLVPKPPYCDADGRPRSLPEPIVHTAASGGMGTPVASRRHVGETPAVKLVPANMQAAARMPPAAVARRRFYDEAVAFVEQLLRQTGASGCSRLRAELQDLGSAAAVVMSKQHARLAIDGNYDAWADLAREVLSSKFLYDELGS